MPNWCYNRYVAVGDADKVRRLKNDIETARADKLHVDSQGNWFKGSLWLCDFASRVGAPRLGRGYFTWVGEVEEREDGRVLLRFTTDTAWAREEAFDEFVSEHYDVALFFASEEGGCDIYESNDCDWEYLDGPYLVDIDGDGKYLKTDGEVIDYVNEELTHYDGFEFTPATTWNEMEALLDRLSDERDLYAHVHEFGIVD